MIDEKARTDLEQGIEDHSLDNLGCFGRYDSAALYQNVRLPDSAHLPDAFPIDDVLVSFTVRSEWDPMLLAKNLSDNTFDFGMSSHDLAAVGFLGLIISLLLVIRPCIVVCSIRRIPKYQDLERMQDHQPVADPELESVIRRRRRIYSNNPERLEENASTLNDTGDRFVIELSRLPINIGQREGNMSSAALTGDNDESANVSLGRYTQADF